MKNRLQGRALLAMMLMLASSAFVLQAKVEQKPVYICGYAVNFTDSTAYLTEIQCIDTAYVESKNGFLMDRNQYSAQLNHYVKKLSGGRNYTCMVLFDKKLSRLQKRVVKVRRRNGNDSSVHLKSLSASEFQFIGEQYVAPDVMTAPDESSSTPDSPVQAKDSRPIVKSGAKRKGGKG